MIYAEPSLEHAPSSRRTGGTWKRKKIASKTREDVSKANYIRKPRRKSREEDFILAILNGSSVACLGFSSVWRGPLRGTGGIPFLGFGRKWNVGPH